MKLVLKRTFLVLAALGVVTAASVGTFAKNKPGAANALAAAPAAADQAAENSRVYVKKDTWTATMLATRANCIQLLAGEKDPSGKPAGQPLVTPSLRGDGPGQQVSVDVTGWKCLRLSTVIDEGTGNCHIWGDPKLIAKDGTEVSLTTLKPTMVSVGWGQLMVDTNWQHHALQIGEKTFKHGLWVHANSDLIFAIDGKYVRFEAWAGLDKDRATGAATFKVLDQAADPAATAWRNIARDFPVQAAWMEEDASLNQHLSWFAAADTRLEIAMIRRASSHGAQSGKAALAELAELQKSKAAADDPRWLDLYARTCRDRDCQTALAKIDAAAVRADIAKETDALWQEKAGPDDARWIVLRDRAAQIAASLATLGGMNPATLRPSVESLVAAFGRKFAGGAGLLKQLGELEQKWTQIQPALARGEKNAAGAAPALCQELANFRHSLLTSMGGMKEFLAAARYDAEGEWKAQFQVLLHDLANRARFAQYAAETYRGDSLIQETDRDPADIVLRRAAALLADLNRTSAAAQLAQAGKELADLQAAGAKIDLANSEARYVLYADACRLRRQIALANPLLDFKDVLFVERHRSTYNHMCDQYYGITARPGGGLYVLENAFTSEPHLRDVLAGATVSNGRLKGQKLFGGACAATGISYDGEGNLRGDATQGGSFIAPDLSYDGKTILFAYVECTGAATHDHHTDPTRGHWNEGRSYHIFQVNADGTNLQQLTDGTWNDFDPVYLPNGRIAFISERRGGYLRCGRTCPNYNLYDMAADGSDINCLSVHETNEWNPSVTNDGRIIYTRWDYVDRFGCTAHQPWITTLDGRDSRAVHGNFAPRNSRPDMELDVRAIPSSQKYVATAAPHHGQAFGSLVLIDPLVPDDEPMGPIKRITPDVGFPESQGGTESYGMAFPLSEDYYLAAYDADMELNTKNRSGRGNYGLYLVDSFGNKELLYRDAGIASISPIPMRATAVPPAPALPETAAARYDPSAAPADQQKPGEATLSVVNVYESFKPWPEGTKIKSLRVMQVLPMSVPSGHPPHDTGFRIALAGDSVVPVRYVLGTVPVEEDGSASFIVPANREMFFQALDDKGLAIQSMRSATYLKSGEHLVCQGCHAPRYTAPHTRQGVPTALQKPPARPTPDVDGSNPFSYPRLVQPVLERNCLPCHTKPQNKSKAPNLAKEPVSRHWYASYCSLVPKYAFTSYGDNLMTTPGKFGAKAAKLYEMLSKGHHDLKLSEEDFHRINLWLDCSSMFYGVYEKEGGEAQLRGDLAHPTLE